MPFVVTEACIRCKYTDCVAVCPMECFVEGPNFLVIDPDGCIDCSVCVPECPVDAIVNAAEIAPGQAHFVALNAELARAPGWRPIRAVQKPLADAEQWAGAAGKLAHLRRDWA
ncbi:MAG: ferredoxin family protein [Roseateles depolymerans]|uniref:Ferredoxin n=1 Tax=Roseateles depolymerans TaxID=76731 RepID=A0A2W5FS84_9BURK|nr:MAG: ferredoxin family protein [Roseateles depolymerans]